MLVGLGREPVGQACRDEDVADAEVEVDRQQQGPQEQVRHELGHVGDRRELALELRLRLGGVGDVGLLGLREPLREVIGREVQHLHALRRPAANAGSCGTLHNQEYKNK